MIDTQRERLRVVLSLLNSVWIKRHTMSDDTAYDVLTDVVTDLDGLRRELAPKTLTDVMGGET